MRRSDWLSGVVALMAGAMAAGVGACVFSFDTTSCDDYPAPGCPGVSTATGSGGSTGGGGTGGHGNVGGTGGDGGSTPPSCIPNEDATKAVGDECGVFVSATGDDGAKGGKNDPFKTFAKAITEAATSTKRIYVCGEAFTEDVTLPAGFEIYGGLDCTAMPRAWTWAGGTSKTKITASAAGKVPLTLSPGKDTLVADLLVTALPSVELGTSSIAVVADKVTATIERCDFVAGAGANGPPGQNFGAKAQKGAIGEKGGDACSSAAVNGGLPVSSGCGNPDSVSGNGGQGFAASAGKGGDGAPGGSPNGGDADTGAGCKVGNPGAQGGAGNPGPGATGIGTLTNKGFDGVKGGSGSVGTPGQGGGGGGGRRGGSGGTLCPMAGSAGGAAGGSGGGGGCGGQGGNGGGGAGSSIALVSIDSKLTFVTVKLTADNGGVGGNGGDGQNGGDGGDPGDGGSVPGGVSLPIGCAGGTGGPGGNGGKGGGGTGGHSLGIAYTGQMPAAATPTTWTATTGMLGAGGTGDNSMGNMGDGAPGQKADMLPFP